MRRHLYRSLMAALLAAGVTLPACSAVLDIDSLQKGGDGTQNDINQPYDMSLGLLRSRQAPQKRVVLAANAGSMSFRWLDLPGAPAAVDLSLGGEALVAQVFSRDHKPYLRVGLRVVALRAGKPYRLSYRRMEQGSTRRGMHLEVTETVAGGAVLLTKIVPGAFVRPLVVKRSGRRIDLVVVQRPMGSRHHHDAYTSIRRGTSRHQGPS